MNIKNYNKTNKEYINFRSISDQWWIENGDFSILHKINPTRIKYIISQLLNKNKNNKLAKLPLKNIKIIDIGCGGGLVCEPLARLGANVTGIDFVKENLEVAKKHAFEERLKIKYKLSDINKLNIRDKYDVILLLEVIEHVSDWKKIIKKMRKILKTNGIIIFSSINRNLISGFLTIFIAENFLKWVPKGTHNYEKLVKPEELCNELTINNYKILNLSGMNYYPLTKKWGISKKNLKINYFCTATKIN